jgi:hypothetical protein
VVLTTQKDKSALPSEETPFQHLPVCINKGSQRLICSLTQLTHLVRKFEGSCSYQLSKKEEREVHCLVEDIL